VFKTFLGLVGHRSWWFGCRLVLLRGGFRVFCGHLGAASAFSGGVFVGGPVEDFGDLREGDHFLAEPFADDPDPAFVDAVVQPPVRQSCEHGCFFDGERADCDVPDVEHVKRGSGFDCGVAEGVESFESPGCGHGSGRWFCLVAAEGVNEFGGAQVVDASDGLEEFVAGVPAAAFDAGEVVRGAADMGGCCAEAEVRV